MNPLAILTMAVVIGIVWGGFLLCLKTAIGKERRKDQTGSRNESTPV